MSVPYSTTCKERVYNDVHGTLIKYGSHKGHINTDMFKNCEAVVDIKEVTNEK